MTDRGPGQIADPGPVEDVGPGEDVGPDSREGRVADKPVTLLLWRHGETDWNVQRRFQGQSNVGLNANGVWQAERAARLIAALRGGAKYDVVAMFTYRLYLLEKRLRTIDIELDWSAI